MLAVIRFHLLLAAAIFAAVMITINLGQAAAPTQNLTTLDAEIKEALKLAPAKKKLTQAEAAQVAKALVTVDNAIVTEIDRQTDQALELALQGQEPPAADMAKMRAQAQVSAVEYGNYIQALRLVLGHIGATPLSPGALIKECDDFILRLLAQSEAQGSSYRMNGATYLKAKIFQTRIHLALTNPDLKPVDQEPLTQAQAMIELQLIVPNSLPNNLPQDSIPTKNTQLR